MFISLGIPETEYRICFNSNKLFLSTTKIPTEIKEISMEQLKTLAIEANIMYEMIKELWEE